MIKAGRSPDGTLVQLKDSHWIHFCCSIRDTTCFFVYLLAGFDRIMIVIVQRIVRAWLSNVERLFSTYF
jgi:hypothetical protein